MLILKILGLICIIFMGRFLERLERENELFWAYAFCVGLFFTSIEHQIIENFMVRESEIVNLTIRGGGTESRKIKNFDPYFHRRLERHFPDWSGRMDFQKKQEEFYKSAMQKKREASKLKLKENFNITPQEQDALDYFNGTGFYAQHQDIKVKPNIFDTRQSFLRKMHDPIALENFLDSFNRLKN